MYHVYTDGSCRGNGGENSYGAWGWIAYENDIPVAMGQGNAKNTTNNRMELKAIIDALIWLNGRDAVIYTDSAYFHNCYKDKWYLNWLKNGWVNSKKEPVKNKDLWELLIPCFTGPFTFVKVKGHADNERNNEVDKMVQEATLKMKEDAE